MKTEDVYKRCSDYFRGWGDFYHLMYNHVAYHATPLNICNVATIPSAIFDHG